MLTYTEVPTDSTPNLLVYNTINLRNDNDFHRFEHTLFSQGLQVVTLLVQDIDKLLPTIQKRLFHTLDMLTGHTGSKKQKMCVPKPSHPLVLHSTTQVNVPPSVKVVGQPKVEVPQLSDLQNFWRQIGIDFSDLSGMPQEYHDTIMELSHPAPSLLRKPKYKDQYLTQILQKSQYGIVDLSHSLFLTWDMRPVDQRFVRSKLTQPYINK